MRRSMCRMSKPLLTSSSVSPSSNCGLLGGVVVALVAVEAHGEEELRGVLHDRVGGAEHLVVAGGRVVEVGARGGQHAVDELVVGHVRGDRLANPGAEGGGPLHAEELAV